ncbi:hypothetical protein TcG_07649 [Trypanosoma cruzi]|uniref:Uncharacterized protein n=1 Tax=Trypanosoma cruzi Dm28c TaxID=1416333 RepID=V5AIE8_TRYCR|nr:hypothetical protein TCDM_12075 [Trypanosoma cruzi Dm28c]RNF14714.1 hypothetical protein TcG_07649 [Trypanosoma cruzi]
MFRKVNINITSPYSLRIAPHTIVVTRPPLLAHPIPACQDVHHSRNPSQERLCHILVQATFYPCIPVSRPQEGKQGDCVHVRVDGDVQNSWNSKKYGTQGNPPTDWRSTRTPQQEEQTSSCCFSGKPIHYHHAASTACTGERRR